MPVLSVGGGKFDVMAFSHAVNVNGISIQKLTLTQSPYKDRFLLASKRLQCDPLCSSILCVNM